MEGSADCAHSLIFCLLIGSYDVLRVLKFARAYRVATIFAYVPHPTVGNSS